MAAPSYAIDLQTIDLAENVTTWDEMADWGGGGTIYEDEQDYLIQGDYCTSQIATKTGLQDITSLVTDYGSDLAGSFTAGETCVFMWHVFLPANALDTFAGGGTRLIVGSSLADFDAWKVGGSDFGRNPYGGWQNVAVDPSYPPDYQDDGAVGNGGVYQWFGSGVYLLRGIGKGAPHGVDAVRYGRGDLRVTLGDLGNGYATFAGMAAANDVQTARWGLFQEQAGGYLWKGLISLGTTTAVDFRDSNRNITIDDTPRTYSSFNRIEVNHDVSRVDWTGINISAVNADGLSIGEFEVLSDAEINFDGCVFTDMGNFTFDSTSTDANLLSCTWRRCYMVTQGNAIFDGCIFDESDSTAGVALYVSDLDNIDNCEFVSAGTGHAMELDSNHAGGSYTLVGCIYENYAVSDGDTGNEVIYNNSGGAVTINISDGDIPTIRNGLGSTTTVVASVVWTFEIRNSNNEFVTGVEFRIYNSGTQTQVYGVENSATGTEVYTFDQSLAGNNVDVVVMDVPDYLYFRQTLVRPSGNQTSTLVLADDRWYVNPDVTKTKTWGLRPTDNYKTAVDTYIDINNGTTKYNTSESLNLDTVQYILFDPQMESWQIPSNATITNAKLWIYVYAHSGIGTQTVLARYIKRDWIPSQTDWIDYATSTIWESAGCQGTADRSATEDDTVIVNATGWWSFDVSSTVQDWADGTITDFNGGWILEDTDIDNLSNVRSSDYTSDTSLRPYLEVTWTQ